MFNTSKTTKRWNTRTNQILVNQLYTTLFVVFIRMQNEQIKPSLERENSVLCLVRLVAWLGLTGNLYKKNSRKKNQKVTRWDWSCINSLPQHTHQTYDKHEGAFDERHIFVQHRVLTGEPKYMSLLYITKVACMSLVACSIGTNTRWHNKNLLMFLCGWLTEQKDWKHMEVSKCLQLN